MAFRRRNDGFQSFSLIEFLTRPFRAISGWFAGLASGDDHLQQVDQTLLGSIFSFLTLPFRVLLAFLAFMINSWAVSRRGLAFIFAVPAIAAIVFSGGAMWAVNFLRETRSVGASQNYLSFFIENPDFGPKTAEIFAEKLVELKPNDEALKYQLGTIRESLGKSHSAQDIMQFLAPVDRVGYPEAHVWLARHYLMPNSGLTDKQSDELVTKHLELATSKDPNNIMAQFTIADFHEMKAKDFDKESEQYKAELRQSLEHLKKVLDTDTIAILYALPRVVKILLELNEAPEAVARMERAVKKLLPMAQRNPDDGRIWASMINACLGVNDYAQAHRLIEEGLQVSKKSDVRAMLEQLAAQAIMQKVKSYTDMKDSEQYRARLNLLCDAIAKYPRNRDIYTHLLDYIAETSNPDFNFKWLQETLIGNPNPGVVHVLLGIRKISQGDVLGGQKHWRIAEQQFPLTQFVVNFLIEVAIDDYADDFENMQDIASMAIELFPNQALLYQTRGTLYEKQGRYAEAIQDFKHATEKMPRLISLRKHLVDCYQQLGQTENAEEQQFQIQTILSGLTGDEKRQAEAAIQQLN